MKTLCFGSLNIDNVYQVPHFVGRGETLAAQDLQIFTGGKGLNQSIALAKAGLEVFHAGAIGADGRFLLDELRKAGADTTYTSVLDSVRTGHAIIQKSKDGDNCILLFGGANQAITREQIDRTLVHFGKGDLLVLQNEISELPYLVSKAKDCGMTVVLNPSPMEESLRALLPQVDLLILNEIEACQLIGEEKADDPEYLIKALKEMLPGGTIVLTLGKDGSVYADGTQLIRQDAVKVRAVDTTAAGDTFTGYLLAGLQLSGDPARAMKMASYAAAIAVTRPGAAPSIPEKDEVLRMMGD